MILDRIVADTQKALSQKKEALPLIAMEQRIADMPTPRDLVAALSGEGVSIIAEIKRASPSKGQLNANLDPAAMAEIYGIAGASALSVLTEPLHFRGCLDDLDTARSGLARARVDRPLLRKDFIIDPYQLFEARYYGADAVLLIVAALNDCGLADLYGQARDLGLVPLVEVHNREELDRALAIEPVLIGINNRDLRTFEVSLAATASLREYVPAATCLVSESGIHGPDEMRQLALMRVDAALVGEALVTAYDPALKLRQLLEAGR